MDKQTFDEVIEYKKSEYADDREKLIDFLIVFFRRSNDDLIECGLEIKKLQEENTTLEKKLESLSRAFKDVRGALIELYDAHQSSWLGDCHCEAHQKAKVVLMNIALWIHKMNHPSAKIP